MDNQIEIKRGEGAFVELLNKEMKELQESQKQIDEMIEIIQNAVGGCAKYWAELIAVALRKNDYRKIPENAVVLTKAEYEKLKDEKADNILANVDKVFKAEFAYMKNRVIRRINKDYAKKVRKETAEKFAERVKMAFYYEFDELIPSIMADKIDEIAKEITEVG